MRSQDDRNRRAVAHGVGNAVRIAVALTGALCIGIVPALRADDSVAAQAAAATADYTTDGRLPLARADGALRRAVDLDTAGGRPRRSTADRRLGRGNRDQRPGATPHRGEALLDPVGHSRRGTGRAERHCQPISRALTSWLMPACPSSSSRSPTPTRIADNWRYPTRPTRDWKKGGGYSVGDAEHLLPDLDTGRQTSRCQGAGARRPAALTQYVLRLAEQYPPRLVLDLHEDELSHGGRLHLFAGTPGRWQSGGRRDLLLVAGDGHAIAPVRQDPVRRDDRAGCDQPRRPGRTPSATARSTSCSQRPTCWSTAGTPGSSAQHCDRR